MAYSKGKLEIVMMKPNLVSDHTKEEIYQTKYLPLSTYI